MLVEVSVDAKAKEYTTDVHDAMTLSRQIANNLTSVQNSKLTRLLTYLGNEMGKTEYSISNGLAQIRKDALANQEFACQN